MRRFLPDRFRALQNRQYFLYFSGHIVSLSGSHMQTMAQAWLVYRMTNSGSLLATIVLLKQAANFIACPIAGAIADRVDRRRLLIGVEMFCMLQSFVLAALVLSSLVEIWHIAVLSTILGLATGFEQVARHSFSPDLVAKEDLPSALMLNSVSNHISRIIGPAIAGVVIGITGEGVCFVLNGLSFLAVLYGVYKIAPRPRIELVRAVPGTLFGEIKEAVLIVRESPQLRKVFWIGPAIACLGYTYTVVFPMICKVGLGRGSDALSILTAMLGLGAVIGSAAFAGTRLDSRRLDLRLLINICLLGVAILILAMATQLWVAALASVGIGMALLGNTPLIFTEIQHCVTSQNRGRILSLYQMAMTGAIPLGSLFAGLAGDWFGPRAGAYAIGGACFAVALGFRLSVKKTVVTVLAQSENSISAPERRTGL